MPIDSSQAINIASQAAIASANNISVAGTDKKERKWAAENRDIQRNWALQDWQAQNEYNSPTSQMERLRKAGLNPNLVYGNGADATATSPVKSTGSQDYHPHAPQVDPATIGNAMSQSYNLKVQEAQYDNLKTQNTVLLEEAALKRSQRMNTDTNTSKQLTETNTAQFDLNMKNRLQDTYAETASENLRKLGADIQYTLHQDERAAAANANTIAQGVEAIARSRAERSKIPGEKQELQHRIQLIDADKALKEKDLWLKSQNIQPGTPLYQKVIYQAAEEFLNADRTKSPMKWHIKEQIKNPNYWMKRKP